MNKPSEPIFTSRPTVTIKLALSPHARILHPEQIIIGIAEGYHDIGALCYALRSDKARKPRQPREVVVSSIIKQRPKQILQVIKALSSLRIDSGKSANTIKHYAGLFISFVDWADANGLPNCLAGGDETRQAFRAWSNETKERYQRQDFGEAIHNYRLTYICELLEATTGLQNLMSGIRKLKKRSNPNGGTEPLALHDFAHAVAINQCLFDGLCDLVLEQRPFPHKLELPNSLGWAKNYLWLFPTNLWRLPPHLQNDAIRAAMGTNASWAYDYSNGRLATVDEIVHRYKTTEPSRRIRQAKESIRKAQQQIDEANADPGNTWRISLGMHAQRAFLFLFFCNTGCNDQLVRDLETDGMTIDAAVRNQKFRALKWRANGKEVELVAPATFMARLRRFMELRRYLLQGRNTPYLFFTCGNRNANPPAQIFSHELGTYYYGLLKEIDPQLPRLGSRALRASVDDYYLRFHGNVVAAAVMGHSPETELRNYSRGSANDHHNQMTLFMTSVSESARRQRVIPVTDITTDSPPLEEGGRCDDFGHPEMLSDHVPIRPDCKDAQGCLFCMNRVLIANEADARKVASAAYVMEQLILGPKHEEVLRPLICKCDEDLNKIAAFPGCHDMVEKVRRDVYENEQLTIFWADKYQLFLELGIIS